MIGPLDSLRRDGSLVERSKALCCRRSDTKHAKNVPLRVVDPVDDRRRINGIVLDTVPYARAFYELFEGAIYLHQARPHLVTKLDLQARYAVRQAIEDLQLHHGVAESHRRRSRSYSRSKRTPENRRRPRRLQGLGLPEGLSPDV